MLVGLPEIKLCLYQIGTLHCCNTQKALQKEEIHHTVVTMKENKLYTGYNTVITSILLVPWKKQKKKRKKKVVAIVPHWDRETD